LLSLAGIPLTGGFLGKFYVVAAGVSAGRWGLVFVLVVASTIGLFYYLRILVAMYSRPVDGAAGSSAGPAYSSPAGSLLLIGLTGVLIWLGVYPSALLRVIDAMTAGLGS
jgi:NADH-quinone oxidoreductase subunit N